MDKKYQKEIIERYMLTGKIWCKIVEISGIDGLDEFSFDMDEDMVQFLGIKPVELELDEKKTVLFDGIDIDDDVIKILYKDGKEYCVSTAIWFTSDSLQRVLDVLTNYVEQTMLYEDEE